MTRIIRSDFEGVVHAHLHDGTLNAVVLQRGDVVPDGVFVGEHLLAPELDDTDAGTSGADPVIVPSTSADGAPAAEAVDGVGGGDQDEPAEGEDTDGDAEELDEELDGDAEEDSDDETSDDEGTEGLDAPRGNASTEAWADYADALGVEFEPGATRTEIQAAIDASKV